MWQWEWRSRGDIKFLDLRIINDIITEISVNRKFKKTLSIKNSARPFGGFCTSTSTCYVNISVVYPIKISLKSVLSMLLQNWNQQFHSQR